MRFIPRFRLPVKANPLPAGEETAFRTLLKIRFTEGGGSVVTRNLTALAERVVA